MNLLLLCTERGVRLPGDSIVHISLFNLLRFFSASSSLTFTAFVTPGVLPVVSGEAHLNELALVGRGVRTPGDIKP